METGSCMKRSKASTWLPEQSASRARRAAARLLPIPTTTFMAIVGVIEIAVGLAILTRWTRLAAYVASAWLLAIAANLVLAGFYDVAVRDVVMAIAAFTLARMAEVRADAPAYGFTSTAQRTGRRVTA